MGISFSASTGDVGASGYSGAPEGTPGYPATSPFVTACGGTTTYINENSDGSVANFEQTAWSNMAYIPNQVNEGGSTGGVSVMEPIPWYQANITSETELGYPNGRLTPDISFNANVFPGAIFVFPGDEEGISGGTSESSPLFAGLLTLVMGAIHNSTGLINPALSSLHLKTQQIMPHAFSPINFGYNDP